MAEKVSKGDIEILSYIAEYKFLTVKQLAAITQRTIQVIRRRLRFFDNSHLIVMTERGFGKGPGRRENIIVLTEGGLELLRSQEILSSHAAYITDKTSDSMFIDHDLLVNWFLIHLLQLEKDNQKFAVSQLKLSSHHLRKGSPDKPFLQEKFVSDRDQEKTVTMIPDGVFTITNKYAEKTLLFFLEVDMGTETMANTKQVPGDVRQKIINYQTLFHGSHYKRYEKIFNSEFNGFRLRFLASTPTRMTPGNKQEREIRFLRKN